MSSNEIIKKLFPDAQCLDPATEAENWQRYRENIERERQWGLQRMLQVAAVNGAVSTAEQTAEPVQSTEGVALPQPE